MSDPAGLPAKKLPSLSIFFPAYKDEGTVASLTQACREVASRLTDDFEILIVDDKSPDRTGEIADEMASRHKDVRVIHHDRNRGVGQAMITGFTRSSKEYVFYTDGDAQYDVSELYDLADHLKDHDIVIGYRRRRAEGWKRVFTSKCFHFLVFLLFGIRHRDIDCSFKLVPKSFLRKFDFKTKSALVDPELLIQARRFRLKVKEAGVTHRMRSYGSSQCLRVRLIVSMVTDLFRLRWLYWVER